MTRLALLPALALLLIGGRGYETRPWGAILLPSADAAGAEQSVADGGVITRSRVVRAPVATLHAPVSMAIASVEQSLPAGSRLVYVTVGGDAAERISPAPEAFCASPRLRVGDAARVALDASFFGLFGGIGRTAPISAHCFIDRDGDGRLDAAFLSGARREDDLEPVAIPPLDAVIERDQPLTDVTEARVTVEPDRAGRRLTLFLETADARGQRTRREQRARVNVGELPKQVMVQGAAITLLAFDPRTRATRLRLDRPMDPGGFGFRPPPQIVYIYIPRR